MSEATTWLSILLSSGVDGLARYCGSYDLAVEFNRRVKPWVRAYLNGLPQEEVLKTFRLAMDTKHEGGQSYAGQRAHSPRTETY